MNIIKKIKNYFNSENPKKTRTINFIAAIHELEDRFEALAKSIDPDFKMEVSTETVSYDIWNYDSTKISFLRKNFTVNGKTFYLKYDNVNAHNGEDQVWIDSKEDIDLSDAITGNFIKYKDNVWYVFDSVQFTKSVELTDEKIKQIINLIKEN